MFNFVIINFNLNYQPMKNFTKIIIALFAVALLASSQITVKAQAFENGSMVANAGLGFGWYNYSYGFGVSSFPALSLSLEKGVKELDFGVLSIGGIAGFKHGSWKGFGIDGSYNDIVVAARAAVHIDLLKMENVDTYGGAALGIRAHNENYPYSAYVNDDYVRPLWGLYAGGRYYFTDKLAGFGEVGFGLGYLTLGLSYKIK